MKNILGLDLGTNSIGWALINKEENKILGMGSRIIPMGTDKLDYERGVGISKNADRRIARTIRKMNKRYKLRRNKLLFILKELGMLPEQFQFKNGIPEAKKLQDLELLPIKKGTLQLDSLQHYGLRVTAVNNPVNLRDFGKILYQFNQLRGYAGGNNEDERKKKKVDDTEEETEKKKYEVITQKVRILKVEKADRTFKAKGGKSKGQELPLFDVTILLEDEKKEGTTMLQALEAGKEEELEIRIKRTKSGENIIFALPQKTNWRKQMEATEEILKTEKLFIGQLLLGDLEQNKWTKIRNRVILRSRYQQEFDAIWNRQAIHNPVLKNCPKDILEKITNYLYPGDKESQIELRKDAINGGLFHIIRNHVIYYQRPLKSQAELISNCRFEKDEKVLPNTHPLFQEFRCWKQINQLDITSKIRTFNERKNKEEFKYNKRYLTSDQKNLLYTKLQKQKQLGFSEVAKIVGLQNDRTEFLNGLNPKAKLKGCDTAISIKKVFNEEGLSQVIEQNNDLIVKVWEVLYNKTGNEYEATSPKVSTLIDILKNITSETTATKLGLKLAQTINYPRKYGSLSKKAIDKILPLLRTNPSNINQVVKDRFEKIQYIIETGEIDDNNPIETYMIEYVQDNPDILTTGGMMDSFALSLEYGKHTTDNIKATIKNYHEIQYNPDRNLRNPVVEQISNETLQVIKAIWKQYNINPQELEIRVELARDLKNSAAEREKIYKGQLSNQKTNEAIKKRLIELQQDLSTENIERYKLWSKQNNEEYPKQSKEPTGEEIQRLRIWEEQKCISPYTLKPIPLSKLFTRDYDIDHIIPKSRLFDDSLTNKVLCESFINEEKSNRTAWEYITQQTTKFEICSVEAYINNVNSIYFGKKKKNLLLEKIPNNFIDRQIKETQYISVAVKNELAKIVGSDNVKSTTGEITNFLRSRWGLKKLFMELTESRFKQMELWDSSKKWVIRDFDKEKERNIYEIAHWSKRYDHRHHAVDALVVALTEQFHIHRLNNLNKELQDWLAKNKDRIKLEVREGETEIEAFFNLEENRREEIQKEIEGFRKFDSPLNDLVSQAKRLLETLIVSHKPKDKLSVQLNDKTNKKELKIRAALHEATFYGKLNGQDTKTVSISNLSAKDITKIIDPVLRKEIDDHRNKKEYGSMKEAYTGEGLKAFNESRFQRKKPTLLKPPVYKVKVRYNTKENTESSLQRLYGDNAKLSVKTGDNYLYLVMEKIGKKGIERVFDIVSLYDAAQIAKDEWNNKNENFKQKIYEDYRIKHQAKPNKILFSLQQNELVYLPENVDDPVLKFSPSEFKDWFSRTENKTSFNKRIYKVVDMTSGKCFFIPNSYSSTISIPKVFSEEELKNLKGEYKDKPIPKHIKNFAEFGSNGSSSQFVVNSEYLKSLIDKKYKYEPIKIIDTCIKIKSDWLGNIELYK